MNPIRITVACATSEEQVLESIDLPVGARIRDLLALAEFRERFPSVSAGGTQPVGIFGRLATPDTHLQAGDRVEFYRALKGDPKEIRRLRGSLRRERQRKTAAP